MGPKVGYITRTETFISGHYLHSPLLTDEENKQVFRKCNNPNGHGHNYKVEVTLKGPIDEKTGMIINLTDLGRVLHEIVDEMDHKHLDKEIEYFKDKTSTAENISVYIWEQLCKRGSQFSHLLYEVKLHETEKNVAIYRGE